MAFTPKTWVNRSVQYAGRYLQTAVAGMENVFDLSRAEGNVFAEGDKPDATALNDLETRIDSAFANIQDELGWTDITSQCTWDSHILTSYTYYAKVNEKIRMIEVSCVLNAGRANNSAVVTLPSAYRPSLSKNMGLGVAYDSVKTMEIEYYLNTTGAIVGAHTIETPTGTAEFVCFNFTY